VVRRWDTGGGSGGRRGLLNSGMPGRDYAPSGGGCNEFPERGSGWGRTTPGKASRGRFRRA
jgi:hypothetical protein